MFHLSSLLLFACARWGDVCTPWRESLSYHSLFFAYCTMVVVMYSSDAVPYNNSNQSLVQLACFLVCLPLSYHRIFFCTTFSLGCFACVCVSFFYIYFDSFILFRLLLCGCRLCVVQKVRERVICKKFKSKRHYLCVCGSVMMMIVASGSISPSSSSPSMIDEQPQHHLMSVANTPPRTPTATTTATATYLCKQEGDNFGDDDDQGDDQGDQGEDDGEEVCCSINNSNTISVIKRPTCATVTVERSEE